MKTAEKLAWMAKYAHTLHIDVNDHRSCYEDLERHLENAGTDPRDVEACVRAGTVAVVQVYPHTPIGFYRVTRPTLEEAVDRAFLSVLAEDLGPEALAAGEAISATQRHTEELKK